MRSRSSGAFGPILAAGRQDPHGTREARHRGESVRIAHQQCQRDLKVTASRLSPHRRRTRESFVADLPQTVGRGFPLCGGF